MDSFPYLTKMVYVPNNTDRMTSNLDLSDGIMYIRACLKDLPQIVTHILQKTFLNTFQEVDKTVNLTEYKMKDK